MSRALLLKIVLLLTGTLALTGCGGGGSGAAPVAGSAPSSDSPTATTSPPPDGTSVPSSATGVYASAPDLASCRAGVLSANEQQRVIDELNRIRALHGLAAVAHDAGADAGAGEAALMMVANRQLSHTPPANWICYSATGAGLAEASNLYLRFSSAGTRAFDSLQAIGALLVDRNVATLGHRRWMLDPFLGPVAWGRADGRPAGSNAEYMAGVLKVIGAGAPTLPADMPGFVAMPHGDYPSALFPADAVLSFSVVADAAGRNANFDQVSFAGAAITLTEPDGNTLPVSARGEDYGGFGLPNLLHWQSAGLRTGVRYTVRIDGVSVKGAARSFEYAFTLR